MAESVKTGSSRFQLGKPPQRAGGSQKRVSANTITRIGPRTKFGTEMPSMETAIEA